VVPSYPIASKEVLKKREKARWVKKRVPESMTSWHNYMTKKVVHDFHASVLQVDFHASVLQVSEIPYNEKTVSSILTVHYKFPNGFHQVRTRQYSLLHSIYVT